MSPIRASEPLTRQTLGLGASRSRTPSLISSSSKRKHESVSDDEGLTSTPVNPYVSAPLDPVAFLGAAGAPSRGRSSAMERPPLERLRQSRFLNEFEEHGKVRRLPDGHGRVFFLGALLSTESGVVGVSPRSDGLFYARRESESSVNTGPNAENTDQGLTEKQFQQVLALTGGEEELHAQL